MTENKEMMTADEMRVPSGSAYDRQIELSIRRRTEYKTDGNTVSAHRDYVIGGKKYIVRSVFDITESKKFEDGIRHLIDTEYDKNS